MAHESIDDLVRYCENSVRSDTSKRIVIRNLARYDDPDDFYYIYETSSTDEGNMILEIVPKNSYYGKSADNWIEVVCDECEHEVKKEKMYDDKICDECWCELDDYEEKK